MLIEHYTKKLESFHPGLTLKEVKINFFEGYDQIICSTSLTGQTIQIMVFKEKKFKKMKICPQQLSELINNTYDQTILCIKNNSYKDIDNTHCIMEMLLKYNLVEKIEYCIIKNYLKKTSILKKELFQQKLNDIKKNTEKKIKNNHNFTKNLGSSTLVPKQTIAIDRMNNRINNDNIEQKEDENKKYKEVLPKYLLEFQNDPIAEINFSDDFTNDLNENNQDEKIDKNLEKHIENEKKMFKNYGAIDILLSQMKYLFFVVLFLYLKDIAQSRKKLSDIFEKIESTVNINHA